ncbi:hypothetical protein E4T56_gene13709, partial [Termitomyces sp. T112]
MPLDLVVIERDELSIKYERRIEASDPWYRVISASWSDSLKAALDGSGGFARGAQFLAGQTHAQRAKFLPQLRAGPGGVARIAQRVNRPVAVIVDRAGQIGPGPDQAGIDRQRFGRIPQSAMAAAHFAFGADGGFDLAAGT